MIKAISFIATAAIACHLAAFEARAGATQTNLVPAFVEQTNGLFAVCAIDVSRQVLLRFRGIEIRRADVPPTGPYHNVPVFALGDRPPMTDPWKPRQEDLYTYGKPPYPIEDIDPPLEQAIAKDGSLVVGFSLRGRCYAVKEIKEPQLKKNLPKKYWSRVVMVDVPVHRKDELKSLLKETVVEKKPESSIASPGDEGKENPPGGK